MFTMGESKSPGARACTAAAENAAIVLPDDVGGGGRAATAVEDDPPPVPAVSTTLRLPPAMSSSIRWWSILSVEHGSIVSLRAIKCYQLFTSVQIYHCGDNRAPAGKLLSYRKLEILNNSRNIAHLNNFLPWYLTNWPHFISKSWQTWLYRLEVVEFEYFTHSITCNTMFTL